MSVQLNPQDFRELVDLVQALSAFSTERDRIRLVSEALAGSPRADRILGNLDLSGGKRGAAVEVVKTLADFGQVVYGKEALGIFLSSLQDHVGVEQGEFLDRLFATYPLNTAAVARNLPIDDWKGRDSVDGVREKIFGENTLRDIRILELALEAAPAVVRIVLDRAPWGGSGFMIAPDLAMTAQHVIGSRDYLAGAQFLFGYQLDRAGHAREPVGASAKPDGVFFTDPALDFTIVELQGVPDFGAPLKLVSTPIQEEDRVAIIQHPAGNLKKISMQNNFVEYADRRVVQYTTSTMAGSSGAPVFNDAFEVVAIHSRGGPLTEPGTGRKCERNAGASMIAVIEHLKANARPIYDRLRRS